ncbi:MAG: hypothetical protein ABI921_04140 [Panacibacter sp.]
MDDTLYRLIFFGIIYTIQFGIVYLCCRKESPELAAKLTVSAWLLMLVITYYSSSLGGLISVAVMIALLFILRKRTDNNALQQFYTENNIYASKQFSQAVLDIPGNKNWMYAEGTLNKNTSEAVHYLLWQGYTSLYVTTGKFTHTTAYTNYLAFIFPPGSVSNIFKQSAIEAADKSHYTFKQKLKFFFVPDTDTPCLVTTAADGHFIIQYITVPDVEHYSKCLNWIKENISKIYYPVTQFSFVNN